MGGDARSHDLLHIDRRTNTAFPAVLDLLPAFWAGAVRVELFLSAGSAEPGERGPSRKAAPKVAIRTNNNFCASPHPLSSHKSHTGQPACRSSGFPRCNSLSSVPVVAPFGRLQTLPSHAASSHSLTCLSSDMWLAPARPGSPLTLTRPHPRAPRSFPAGSLNLGCNRSPFPIATVDKMTMGVDGGNWVSVS